VKPLKNCKVLLAVFLFAVAAATPVQLAYSSTLTVTVFTDKPSYLIAENITVFGNLTYDGSPVLNWPVALEVQDPTGIPVVTRTTQTDTGGTYNVTFKLPTDAMLGTYTVYVSSGYKGETATDNTTFEIIPIRDVAVTNVASLKTVVGQGYSVNITVAAENQGEPTETFNVTVFCNETAITLPNGQNYTTVTLASGESTVLALTWNTSGFIYGNYTLSAYAWPVPEEIDVANNNCTCNVPIHVGVPGDVSGPIIGVCDGQANMRDINYLIGKFNSKPGDSKWIPNADVNDDNVINMRDIQIAILNFNKHE